MPLGPDPRFTATATMTLLWGIVYEPLLSYDPIKIKEENEYRIIPWLAESYEVAPDLLSVTFNLREGIKFAHTGNEMTADDVVWTVETALLADYPVHVTGLPARYLPQINGVEKIDDYTVRVTLSEPNPSVVAWFADYTMSILDSEEIKKHIVEYDGMSDHGWTWLYKEGNDAGTGPYVTKEFVPMERFVVEKNPDYWGGPPDLELPEPKIDTIMFVPVEEPTDAKMKLFRGDLQICVDLDPPLYESLQLPDAVDAGVLVTASPGNQFIKLMMHSWRGPTKDWRVRLAIKKAIDYTAIAEDVMGGTATKSVGSFMPGSYRWQETADFFKDAEYEEANALLDAAEADAVYERESADVRFTMDIVVRNTLRYGVNFGDVSLQVIQNLLNVGINVRLKVYHMAQVDAIFGDITEIMMTADPGHLIDLYEPPSWLHSRSFYSWDLYDGWNETSQSNIADEIQTMKDLYSEILSTSDYEDRVEKWIEFEKLHLQYSPDVWLLWNKFRIAYRTEVKGYFHSAYQMWPAIFWVDVEA